jgi:hypothetical protein
LTPSRAGRTLEQGLDKVRRDESSSLVVRRQMSAGRT